MRHVNSSPNGFTLIELLVTLSIVGILAAAGLPQMGNYLANSKLRESANTLVATATLARSEAIKSNRSVSMTVSGETVSIARQAAGVSTTVRQVQLPPGVQASSVIATFDSSGRLSPFGTVLTLGLSLPNKACSDEMRCPAVRIEAGGATNICTTGVCS